MTSKEWQALLINLKYEAILWHSALWAAMATLKLPRKQILLGSSLWVISLVASVSVAVYGAHLQDDANAAINELALQRDGNNAVIAGASYRLLQQLKQRPSKEAVKHFFQDALSGKVLSLVSWEDNSGGADDGERAGAGRGDEGSEKRKVDASRGSVTVEVAGSLMDYFTLINEFQEQYPTVAVKPVTVQRKDGMGHMRFQLDL